MIYDLDKIFENYLHKNFKNTYKGISYLGTYNFSLFKSIVTGVSIFWTNVLVLKNQYTFMSLEPHFLFFPLMECWNT